MLLQFKCPDCKKVHFLDVHVVGSMNQSTDTEELIQFVAENIKLNSILPAEVVLKNI